MRWAPSPHRLAIRLFQSLSGAAAVVSVATGLALLSRRPAAPVLLIAAGLSLWCARAPGLPRWETWLSRVLALALLTWCASARLDTTTLTMGVLMGVALCTVHVRGPVATWTTRLAALGAMLVAFATVVGDVNRADRLRYIAAADGAPLAVGICVMALGAGVLLARHTEGLTALLIDEGGGGVLARRLLPAAVLVPIILGRFWVVGERAGLYGSEGGVSLFVVGSTAVFVYLVARSAMVVHAADRQRAQLLAREQALRQDAEAANLAKGTFLAVMSHELRTPLSAIIGYEELLADGITGPVTDGQRQQLSRIKASARHLLQLIDEILMFSRAEAGREELVLEPVPLAAVVDEAVGLVMLMADDKNVSLGVTPAPSVVVRTDRRKVRQILVNLLSNAIKFTERGGHVLLEITRSEAAVLLTVRDSGIGIPSHYLEQIFDPFWQVEQQPTRRVGGAGLGLSVSRRLARLLGGDITVESVVGRGSVFTATLPLTE
jgi:two-component system, sensor histidine kinase and response regulator